MFTLCCVYWEVEKRLFCTLQVFHHFFDVCGTSCANCCCQVCIANVFWNEFYQDPSHHFTMETLVNISQHGIQDLVFKFLSNAWSSIFYYLVMIIFVILWGRQSEILSPHFQMRKLRHEQSWLDETARKKSICDRAWYVWIHVCVHIHECIHTNTYFMCIYVFFCKMRVRAIISFFTRIYLFTTKRQFNVIPKIKAS